MAGEAAMHEAAAAAMPSHTVSMAILRARGHTGRVAGQAAEIADQAAMQLRTNFPNWNVEARVMNGTPEWELIETAKDWNADLVVVGSQGRSAIGRLLMGSVSKKVVTDSQTSVRVVRSVERKKESSPPRILIGVDGSPSAGEAVKEVGRRAWPDGTEVRLVAVQDWTSPASISARLPRAAGMIEDVNQKFAERMSIMLKWATEELKAIGLNVSISIQRGDPKRILLREARKWNADSIFVGTRDLKSGLERVRLGSVSSSVVTDAPCTVEVVRPAV
jgi:nucleotide-binding universal stress UspA family protein